VILTDREIQIAMANDHIVISPSPETEAFSSTTVDLRLGDDLIVFKETKAFVDNSIDPTHPEYDYATAINTIADKQAIGADGFKLKPATLVLGWTMEKLTLPFRSRIAARVEGKSSLARLGLCVHMTAPTIQAGFDGVIQLELINQGPRPIVLRPGLRICQLIFETTLGTPNKGYDGQFSGQSA
jgi:dCTP deaminase